MSTNQPRPSKAQRREAARLKAKELREAEARRARRNTIARRSFIGAAGVVMAGGFGYLGYLAVKRNKTELPEAGKGLATKKANQDGVPKQVLEDGSWTYGEGDKLDTVTSSAPVLDIYFDYSCSHCAQFEGIHTQVLETKNQSLMSVDSLVAAATKVGVPNEVSAKFKAAIDSDKYKNWVKISDEAFSSRGLESTPTIFFKGEKADLKKLQTSTSLTELATGTTPTAQPTQQPAEQSTQQPAEQPAEQQGAEQQGEQG